MSQPKRCFVYSSEKAYNIMGKKKIANKFAAVKRIISSKDHRMYIQSY